jgi:hypothetical protein
MQTFGRRPSALFVHFCLTFGNSVAMAANVLVQLDRAWAAPDESCKSAYVVKGRKWGFCPLFGPTYLIAGTRYEGPNGVCAGCASDKCVLSGGCR